MTEKQRSDAGLPYFPGDEELRALRARCKQLCYAFNTTEHQQREERINLLRQLLGSTNGRFLIEPSFWCDYGYNIHLGKNFYANHNCVILDCAKVTFGDHVMVGPNCGFYTACHPIDPQQRREGPRHPCKHRCRGQSLSCAALHLGSGPDGLDAMTVPLLSYGTHFSF